MKWSSFLLLTALLMMSACGRKQQHQFSHEVLLPMTPVKDQGKTELCWAYAMLDGTHPQRRLH